MKRTTNVCSTASDICCSYPARRKPMRRRGARLFFTPATGGAGGAGCFGCHSGPMLNKQHNDPDVAGIGAFVEELEFLDVTSKVNFALVESNHVGNGGSDDGDRQEVSTGSRTTAHRSWIPTC
jgi:hypothetical protein